LLPALADNANASAMMSSTALHSRARVLIGGGPRGAYSPECLQFPDRSGRFAAHDGFSPSGSKAVLAAGVVAAAAKPADHLSLGPPLCLEDVAPMVAKAGVSPARTHLLTQIRR
jgi:hypothetical protein